MASIKDVAKRAGVSISTVSRYINRTAFVDEQKAEAIREAMEHYRYAPSQFGRGLVKQKTNLIGFYASYTSGSLFNGGYYTELLKGIENVLRDRDYSIVILNEHSDYELDPDVPPRYIEFVRQKKIDGLILSGITNRIIREKTFTEIMEMEFPMVYIGQRVHERGMNVYAQLDSYRTQMVVELYRMGHRRILSFFDEIHERYRAIVEENVRRAIPDADFSIVMLQNHFGYETVAAYLQEYVLEKGVTAIVSSTIFFTNMIYNWCSEHGLSIPNQVSVLSVENTRGEGENLSPQVSVFCTQTVAMGESAADLVVRAIEHKEIPQKSIELPAIYIPRGSVAQKK